MARRSATPGRRTRPQRSAAVSGIAARAITRRPTAVSGCLACSTERRAAAAGRADADRRRCAGADGGGGADRQARTATARRCSTRTPPPGATPPGSAPWSPTCSRRTASGRRSPAKRRRAGAGRPAVERWTRCLLELRGATFPSFGTRCLGRGTCRQVPLLCLPSRPPRPHQHTLHRLMLAAGDADHRRAGARASSPSRPTLRDRRCS